MTLSQTGNTGPTGLRLLETFRNLFYTPIYVAVSGGFLYRRGLSVKFSTMPEGGAMMETLRSGDADIAQTGISRSLVELDEGREDAPLHFAEINSRDGFFLVAREPFGEGGWRCVGAGRRDAGARRIHARPVELAARRNAQERRIARFGERRPRAVGG